MARLRVGQDYLDLKSNFKPNLKIGANSIGDISKKTASYSVDFSIPWTSKNKTILNYIGDPNINAIGASGKINDVVLEFDGVSYKGFLRVKKIVYNVSYEVHFMTDLAEWSDLIKGKQLRDVNLSVYDHKYNEDNVTDSFTNTEGYIYPFVNYGFWSKYVSDYIGEGIGTYKTKYNNWYPAIYDKTTLRACLNDVGWSLDENSELLKEPRFQNQVTLFSDGLFNYRDEDIDKTKLGLMASYGDAGFSPPFVAGVPQLIPFELSEYVTVNGQIGSSITVGTRNEYLWDDVTYTYTIPFDGKYRLGDLKFSNGVGLASVTIVHIYINGVSQYQYNITPNSGGLFKNLLFTAQEGDSVQFYVEGNVNTTYRYAEMFNSPLQIEAEAPIPYDGQFTLASYLPNMSQTDFIRDIAISYGCMVTTNPNNKTVKFDLFKSIGLKKSLAVDWTHKLDTTQNTVVNYTSISEKYGKRNYFTYKQDESEDNANEGKRTLIDYNNTHKDIPLGNGRFDINNDFLKDSHAVYQSPFGSSPESSFGVNMRPENAPTHNLMFVPHAIRDVAEVDEIITGNNVELFAMKTPKKGIVIRDVHVGLIIRDNRGIITVGNTDNTSFNTESLVPFCYFTKQTKQKYSKDDMSDPDFIVDEVGYNLSYNTLPDFNNDKGLLEDYYTDQISLINRGNIVSVLMKLTEADFISIDFTQPFRLNIQGLNGLFIINGIPKLNSINESVEVDLIKL
jgi:hypothetical protein